MHEPETIVDGIAWTETVRGDIIPTRRFQNPVRREKLLSQSHSGTYPLDREACLRPLLGYSYPQHRESSAKGLASSPAHWRPAIEKAIENAANPTSRTLEVDAEVAAVTLELYPLWAACPFWLVDGGIVFALRTLIRCVDVAVDHGGGARWIVERQPGDRRGQLMHDRFTLLRCMLADAIEPVYDEAHGVADHTFNVTPHDELKLLLAFVFPEEHAWAEAVAKTALAVVKTQRRPFELAAYLTVAPAKTALAMLERQRIDLVEKHEIATLLAQHGAHAAPVIAKALARAPNDFYRADWCPYLMAIRTKQAARAFGTLLDGRPANRVFRRFASKHAALMRAK